MALQAGGGMLARCGRCDPHILNSPWNLPDKKCYYSDLYPYSSGGKKDLMDTVKEGQQDLIPDWMEKKAQRPL